MTKGNAVLLDALRLPAEERANVAEELLASLDPRAGEPDEQELAWAIEIERRARRVLAGESAGVPWPEVRARIRDELTRR